MLEPKDPAIKLFGKTIPVLELPPGAPLLHSDVSDNDNTVADQENASTSSSSSLHGNTDADAEDRDVFKERQGDEQGGDGSKAEDAEGGALSEGLETCNSGETTLKKPDKILPCPRCNSMDTKFCYYNNYNVNQPRHFCKNCQRYWTAGGTMRNVPVGAGRRKNKNSSPHHRQITVSEPFQKAQPEVSNGGIAFGMDKQPLCESMASVLNLTDKPRNGMNPATTFRLKEETVKSGSQGPLLHNFQGFFAPQIPCFPGPPPLPYPWSPTPWSFPVPFYPPTPYWSFPWLLQSPSSNQPTLSSGSSFPTLGKHSRDDNMSKSCNFTGGQHKEESNAEKCLWIPKTLRIDDAGEAAKSSIWTTLGIKKDKSESVDGGLFRAFKEKGDNNPISQPSPALQVNPAALSRSIKFHENS